MAVVVLSAAFIASAAANDKDSLSLSRPKKIKFMSVTTKNQLKKQNSQLKNELDSMRMELERYRTDYAIMDSINNEMMAMYRGNEGNGRTSILPEDYTAEISDSLLNLWTKDLSESFDMDSVKFESNVPDQVYIERIEKMNSFITLPYNEVVRNYIILYSEKMPTKMSHILGLCNYYMPIFQEVLNKYNLPEELKAMAVIESALNPVAVSRAGAKGMWQFMYSTAKMYGLHIDSFVDERLDPFKSADAAARYLEDAYEIFGDWNLAIASYNCGAGNVNKAIRRSGGKRAFWDIYPYLPRETRGYVPAFVGALYAMTYYKEHGIKPEAIEMPIRVDTFKINKMMHLKQVSELVGIPLEEVKNLNPQYTHDVVPGNSREYLLRLPYTYTNSFIANEDSLYTYKADQYLSPATLKKIVDGADGERIVYKVKSGDYLGRIASKYRCSVAQIKKWNGLKSNNLRVGQKLVIYRGGSSSSSAAASTAKPASSTTAAKPANNTATASKPAGSTSQTATSASTSSASGEYTTYTIKSGDSFYSIAKNYPGVSAQDIMNFNKLSSSKIQPGMKIKIPKK